MSSSIRACSPCARAGLYLRGQLLPLGHGAPSPATQCKAGTFDYHCALIVETCAVENASVLRLTEDSLLGGVVQ